MDSDCTPPPGWFRDYHGAYVHWFEQGRTLCGSPDRADLGGYLDMHEANCLACRAILAARRTQRQMPVEPTQLGGAGDE